MPLIQAPARGKRAAFLAEIAPSFCHQATLASSFSCAAAAISRLRFGFALASLCRSCTFPSTPACRRPRSENSIRPRRPNLDICPRAAAAFADGSRVPRRLDQGG